MKYLTEAEAFRAIAEKFATGTQHYPKFGICAEIRLIEVRRDAPYHVTDAMFTRCYGYVGDCTSYAYGHSDEKTPYGYAAIRNDEGRALACLWMALEAEEGGK